MKILIVEDNALLQQGLTQALEEEGYRCDCAENAKQAEALLCSATYSAVLLDLGLPDRNGLSLLQQWRERSQHLPILIITARDRVEDRVQGLDAGADDYLIKPFELIELFARLRAAIRRHQGVSNNYLVADQLSLDIANRRVLLSGQEVSLTAREFAVLSRLMLKKNEVVLRELLQQDIYSWQDQLGSNTLEVYIHNLRNKLGKERIRTVRGFGYRLEEFHA